MEKPKQINIGTENHPLNVFRADAINAYLSSIADMESLSAVLLKTREEVMLTKHESDIFSTAISDHIKGNK